MPIRITSGSISLSFSTIPTYILPWVDLPLRCFTGMLLLSLVYSLLMTSLSLTLLVGLMIVS
jgi:hypothetical protein